MSRELLRLSLWIPVAAILFVPVGEHGGIAARLAAIGVALLIGLPGWLLSSGAERRELYPLQAPPLASLLPLLSLAVGLQGVFGWLDRLWPLPLERALRMADSFRVESALEQALLVCGVLLAAPLMEELFFRGFLYTQLERLRGPLFAVFGSALFFALLHLNPWHFPALLLLGLLLAVLRIVSRSLWPAIVVHAANNGIALLVLQRPEHPLLDWIHAMGAGGPGTPLLLGLPGAIWLLIRLREFRG